MIPRILKIDGHEYHPAGEPLGPCVDCGDADCAYYYDQYGKLLCEECLLENHAQGDYTN